MDEQASDRKEIMDLYEKLSALNEGYYLENNHSEQWKKLLETMSDKSKEIAEKKWPFASVKVLTDTHAEETYIPMDYKKTTLKILSKYNPEKLNKDQKPVPFWGYYMLILRNDVFQYSKKIKLKKLENDRLFKIPERMQRKLNKMLHIVKEYKKQHPEEAFDLYCPRAKQLFLDEKICNDPKELDEILQINKMTYAPKSRKQKNKTKDTEHKTPKTVEDEGSADIDNNYLQIEEELALGAFFKIISKSYELKINTKKQKPEDQLQKEQFMKDIITCYYINNLWDKYTNLELAEILKIVQGDTGENRKFLSLSVIRKYQEVGKEIEKINRSGDPDKRKKLKTLIKCKPATLEFLSISHNKKKNYGTKRITDFRKFVREYVNELQEPAKSEYLELINQYL